MVVKSVKELIDLEKLLEKQDVTFDSNGKVPRLYIKGQEVNVVAMTNYYVTSHDRSSGLSSVTFVYLVSKDNPEEKVLSIDRITGEVLNQ